MCRPMCRDSNENVRRPAMEVNDTESLLEYAQWDAYNRVDVAA